MRHLPSSHLVMIFLGAAYAGSFYMLSCAWVSFVVLGYLGVISFQLSLLRGIAWGGSAYAIHLWWIMMLLWHKSYASPWLAIVLYGALVIYYAASCGIWFLVSGVISRRLPLRWQRIGWYILITTGYFIWLERWSLWFVRSGEGYPFFSPLICLARYKTILFLLQCICQTAGTSDELSRIAWHHIKPDSKPAYRQSPYVIGQRMAAKLRRIRNEEDKINIAVLPESAFPYIIEERSADMADLKNQSDNQFVMAGCLSCDNKSGKKDIPYSDIYQSFICMYKRRIIDFKYHKKHTIPFVESIPWQNKNNRHSCINSLFIRPHHYILKKSRGVAGRQCWSLTPEVVIIPALCSDLIHHQTAHEFVAAVRQHATSCARQPIIVWAVNDSWFITPVRRWLETIGYIRSVETGLPVIYVSHTKLLVCKPHYPYYT